MAFKLLPLSATIRCDHKGKIENKASQGWVTIESIPVLVDADPEGRSISFCPNRGANIKPCKKTLKVNIGYSTFTRIDKKSVVLSSLKGNTDGTPPGFVDYVVTDPTQRFVEVDE